MRKIFTVIITLICFIIMPVTAHAWNCDDYRLFLESKNSPEGTFYVDLLVKMDNTNENWTDFTRQPQKVEGEMITDIPIGADSDIAKYNEDGFVSFAFHSTQVKDLRFERDLVYMDLKCEAQEVFDTNTIKAAYVDENGKILDITDIALADQAMMTPYTLSANGHNATLISPGLPEETKKEVGKVAAIVTIVISLILLALVLLTIFIIKKVCKSLKSSKK